MTMAINCFNSRDRGIEFCFESERSQNRHCGQPEASVCFARSTAHRVDWQGTVLACWLRAREIASAPPLCEPRSDSMDTQCTIGVYNSLDAAERAIGVLLK